MNQEKGIHICACKSKHEIRKNVRLSDPIPECSCGKPMIFIEAKEEKDRDEAR